MSKGARKGTRNRKDEVHYITSLRVEDKHWLNGKKILIKKETKYGKNNG